MQSDNLRRLSPSFLKSLKKLLCFQRSPYIYYLFEHQSIVPTDCVLVFPARQTAQVVVQFNEEICALSTTKSLCTKSMYIFNLVMIYKCFSFVNHCIQLFSIFKIYSMGKLYLICCTSNHSCLLLLPDAQKLYVIICSCIPANLQGLCHI